MISQAGLFALSPVLMLALPFIVIDELGLLSYLALAAGFFAAAFLSGPLVLGVIAFAGTGGRGVVFAASGAVAAGWAGFIGLTRRSVI